MKLVIISSIRDDGYAFKAGFKKFDLIYRINGAPVENPEAVTDSIKKGPAQFTIIRSDEVINITVETATLGVVLNETDFNEKEWLERKSVSSVLLTTAQNIHNREIINTLGIVGAQCVYGVNAFADLAVGIRELVGGRSQVLQKKIAEARLEVCRELQGEAHMLGGNGVVAVTFEHTEIGDKSGYMLMVTGTGTAVIFK